MITSFSNERVKFIRSLQERKFREESGMFFVEGLRPVAEAIAQDAVIDSLIVSPELLNSDFGLELITRQRAQGTPVIEVSRAVFLRISNKEGPQGLAATVQQRWYRFEDIKIIEKAQPTSRTWVALDSVADPGNLGTILRTHDAVGGEGIVLLGQSTDPYDLSSVRGSMGALFSQRLVKGSYNEFAEWKKQASVPVIGASGAARVDYTSLQYPDPCILLMGSERQGLSERYLNLCEEVVSIPMAGASDSLNLAVATAVILYEIYNQRRK